MSYKSSPFKMVPKSPAMKALKGEQGLKKAIEASPAKQTRYRDLHPKDARTQADSVAVETSYLQNPDVGEAAGKVASGGEFKGGRFIAGKQPDGQRAKDMKNDLRKIARSKGKKPMDAYKEK